MAALVLLAPGVTHAENAPCPAASPQYIDLPVSRATLAAGKSLTIVAFGSSSTAGTGASAPDRAYPARLEAFLRTRWPGVGITMLNRGIGGQTAEAMLARLNTDVLAAKPTLVIWQTGTNDSLHHVDTARFSAALDEGVRRMSAAGADVVLMDNQLSPRMSALDDEAVYDAILADEAAKATVALVSRTALMRDWLSAGEPMDGVIGRDGLHHTDRGYACLAEALADSIVTSMVMPERGGDDGVTRARPSLSNLGAARSHPGTRHPPGHYRP